MSAYAELKLMVEKYLGHQSEQPDNFETLKELLASVEPSNRKEILAREGSVAGYTILHRAIKNNHIKLVDTILSAIPEAERLGILLLCPVTPLHVAALVGSKDIVDNILKHLPAAQQRVLTTTTTRVKGAAQQTPLEWATEVGHTEIISILREIMDSNTTAGAPESDDNVNEGDDNTKYTEPDQNVDDGKFHL